MCGIWSYISPIMSLSPDDYHRLYNVSQMVRRRGPDKSSVVMHPNFLMVFHRLSFHDTSPIGDQPFVFYNNEETIFLSANGEIYNHKELKKKYNLQTRSNSDCEVIYHLFQHFNQDLLKTVRELDGEFAFVMIQVKTGSPIRIMAARDPFGVRPLFYGRVHHDNDAIVFSSLVKDMVDVCPSIHVFQPGVIFDNHVITSFHSLTTIIQDTPQEITLYKKLTDLFIDAVRKRLDSERPVACLLSGGLDSSLVAAVAIKLLGRKDIRTFTIGMQQGTDHEYANKVSQSLGNDHTSVVFTKEEGLEAIDEVILACETWDITTIRASVGQFLLAKYISKNTECRTVLNGDGADEVAMGYLYWYNSPSEKEAHQECIRRLEEIHLYDGLRVDRCLGYHGLEARLPFLDKEFVEFYLSIPIHMRMPMFAKKRMEKFLLRSAFHTLYPGLLPEEVLWRKKEAFSDGVSSVEKSWYKMIQDWVEDKITDECEGVLTKEALYYKKKFDEFFGEQHTSVIPDYWLPKWTDIKEPSARALSIYF